MSILPQSRVEHLARVPSRRVLAEEAIGRLRRVVWVGPTSDEVMEMTRGEVCRRTEPRVSTET